MDYCLSYTVKSSPVRLHRPPIPASLKFSDHRRVSLGGRDRRGALLSVVARAGAGNCEFSSLNTPLEPESPAGKFLSGLLLNDVESFHDAVGIQLEKLASDWEEAVWRMNLSLTSDEAGLHRRIAELREQECQIAVQDVMYMLVLQKFNKIKVHLVPRLSRCIYNRRLEIWPSKDWELQSIHSFEVLEMIREHLTIVTGWKAESNVADNWATTQIPLLQLCQVYAASILYGYFLKSASLRHRLELSLGKTYHNTLSVSELCSCRLKNVAFGRISSTQSTSVGQESCTRGQKRDTLRSYIMGFDPDTLQMCAKPKTREAASLIEKHSCALFGDEKTGLIETNEVIVTSLSSLKRMVLEAVAFGSFLWDAEEYVDTVYKLKEN